MFVHDRVKLLHRCAVQLDSQPKYILSHIRDAREEFAVVLIVALRCIKFHLGFIPNCFCFIETIIQLACHSKKFAILILESIPDDIAAVVEPVFDLARY